MKGNALVIAIGKGKPKGEKEDGPDDSEQEESSESEEDKYAEELGGMLGVKDEDMDDFKSALTGFVRACASKDYSAPEE